MFLEHARILFLIQYYLHGISFVDLAHLKKNNIVKLNDGEYFIYKRQKLINNTKAKILQAKITPELKLLIEKSQHYRKPIKDYIFPDHCIKKRFQYRNTDGIVENWMLVFVQNNVKVISENQDPVKVLDEAFHFLETYMIWEDINIDFK